MNDPLDVISHQTPPAFIYSSTLCSVNVCGVKKSASDFWEEECLGLPGLTRFQVSGATNSHKTNVKSVTVHFWSWMNLILILTPGLLVISFFESCTSIVFPVFYYLILLIIFFPLRFYFGVRVDNNCTEERAHREHVWGNNLDHLKLRTINQ